MYNAFQLGLKYLHYLIHASNGKGHGIHSPFVFDFVVKVLNDRTHPEVFESIENYRRTLLTEKDVLLVEDFGAGSAFGDKKQRRVCDIARRAAKAPKLARLLYRVASYYQCGQILELGTSLGISTAYLASPGSVERVVTLEGASAVAARARRGFESLGLDKVQLIVGNFDESLPAALKGQHKADLVFIDGNHREEPTLRYFRQCLASATEESIFIFDDIHWSREMESAWARIQSDPAVRCTIDLFFVGIVFLRKSFLEKQHFVIRY